MTRINSAIPVECLTDEHLLAEHREIKRLPECLMKAIRANTYKNIPDHFTLGRGHISFFYDKLLFCMTRYMMIFNECKLRGMRVQCYAENFCDWDDEFFKTYRPTPEERDLLVDRITERIKASPKQTWHYYGKPISKDEAIGLLK